ncbi:UNVERIFIED_CONTAM: hypothetical protein Sradi_2068200 [Sesamum radiatum]|uniref:Uncharacterized protein n=1 Tax=Sesamum radiatum TaxID=300843 RepID=A0AAW2TI11_SESRA
MDESGAPRIHVVGSGCIKCQFASKESSKASIVGTEERKLLRVSLKCSKLRISRQGIEGPIETCTEYCSRVSSAGDVGRLCNFSGLVGKLVD